VSKLSNLSVYVTGTTALKMQFVVVIHKPFAVCFADTGYRYRIPDAGYKMPDSGCNMQSNPEHQNLKLKSSFF